MQHENSSVPLPDTRAVVPWNKRRAAAVNARSGATTIGRRRRIWAVGEPRRRQRVRI